MTATQFFVYRRPIAWTALVATFLWGACAYLSTPQRHDPEITVGIGVIATPYPGAGAEKVEQELTRKIERKLGENAIVENVWSVSRQGLSLVFVELVSGTKDAAPIWEDLETKLRNMSDLPVVGGVPVQPRLDRDFGDTVAVMLTISSPPVSDFEVDLRSRTIREALEGLRAGREPRLRADRLSAVLVHPDSMGRSYVQWIGRSLMERLAGLRLAEDLHVVETPGCGALDFHLASGRTEAELIREIHRWQRDTLGTGLTHPDLWPPVLVRDLATLRDRLRLDPRDPSRVLNRYTYRELHRFADQIQDRLKRSPNVGKVVQVGVQEEAVHLYYSGRRLAAMDLTPRQVAARLQQRNINLPGGRVDFLDQNVLVQPSGEFHSEQEIGDVVLDERQGYPVYLRDMVDIVRGYEDPPGVMNFRTVKIDASDPPTARLPGERSPRPAGETGAIPDHPALQTTRAVTLAIRQVPGKNVAEFGRDIDQALDSLRGVLPDDLRIERTSDEPAVVREKIGDFNRNLVEASLIVILVALLFMEWRSALLVAFSIPLTVAMTLGLCHLCGVDLQQVSIAALIIALGLLVDDPVVAGDAINRELAAGKRRDVAAWLGPQKLARAIFFATLTNCVAFLPLLLVTGKTGQFIWSLPVVVTASLVSSRIVSMTFMPLLGFYALRGQKGFESAGGSTFARGYSAFSEWCLRHRAITLGACGLSLVAMAAFLPLIGTAFFPKDLHTVFTVNVFTAEGSPIRQTRDEAMRIVRAIDRLEGRRIRAYTTFIGAGGPRFWLSTVPEQRADNYAQILVHTTDKFGTSDVVRRLKRSLPPECTARVTIEQLETGPPVGVPVQIRLFGNGEEQLRRLAARTKEMLRSIPGTDNIHDDWDPEVFQLTLQIEPDKANLAGITNQDVATILQAGLSGHAPTTLRERDRLIPVTLRLRADERTRHEDLRNLVAVSASTGRRVPLDQIASLRTELTAPKILRRNHERCLTVKCDTVPGVLPSRIVGRIDPLLARESRDWPPGCHYEFGGEKREQQKGFASLSRALIASLVAIYLVLVWQFNSVAKPLIVCAAVPFGLLAGLMGLVLFHAPLGFMAFLGVASLAGVIVSHIIVLFDCIEDADERGEELHRAVIDSALVRLRPVLVTVLATVGGLVPLALEGGPLWEPMCYVQIVGLLAASLVTLVVVPVLYVVFVEDLKLVAWGAAGRLQGPPAEYATP